MTDRQGHGRGALRCLRPEDARTNRGSGQASRNIGCSYRVDTVWGQGSVVRAMQTDARYCSYGWRVGDVSPRSYQHGTGQPQLPLMTCADHAAWERNAVNMSLLFCRQSLGPGVRFWGGSVQ